MRGVDDELPDPEQAQAPIRVVLADDSVLLREGIASLLTDKGFEIVGQSGTAEDLLLKVRSYNPDIAIVDIKMPPTHTDEGLRAAKEIREKHPGHCGARPLPVRRGGIRTRAPPGQAPKASATS